MDHDRQLAPRPSARIDRRSAAEPLAAVCRRERDVDQTDLIRPAVDVQPADRLGAGPAFSITRNSQVG
jgi:hypothetical protein